MSNEESRRKGREDRKWWKNMKRLCPVSPMSILVSSEIKIRRKVLMRQFHSIVFVCGYYFDG